MRRLMAVVAHPDDESLGLGGTLARYAREGCFYRVFSSVNGGRIRERDLFEGFPR